MSRAPRIKEKSKIEEFLLEYPVKIIISFLKNPDRNGAPINAIIGTIIKINLEMLLGDKSLERIS